MISCSVYYLWINSWLELDNCLSVAQLVRVLHLNRRAGSSILARGLIVAFLKLLLVRSNKCMKIPLENLDLQIHSRISCVELDAQNPKFSHTPPHWHHLIFMHRLFHSFTISYSCFHESMYLLNERTHERLNEWMKINTAELLLKLFSLSKNFAGL